MRTPIPAHTDRAPLGSAWRRLVLAAGAIAITVAETGAGCSAPFDAPSSIDGLRVLAVVAERPCPTKQDPGRKCGGSYADPGDELTFTMTYYDGLDRPDTKHTRHVQVVWIGGCFDPPGDEYFRCYEQLAAQFQGVLGKFSPGDPIPENLGIGDTFTMKVPEEIYSSRPVSPGIPHYGIGYVFFMACAGHLGVVSPEGTGDAQSFPIGCFDDDTGERLGADSFVPGYTQYYSFDPNPTPRANENPRVTALTLDGKRLDGGGRGVWPPPPEGPLHVERCPVTDDERRQRGCSAEDPLTTCTTYDISALIPRDVAETDPDSQSPEGAPLTESVWVDYYANQGDLDSGAKLVADPEKGFQDAHESKWVPPSEPGLATLWAVVHDARGGMTVVRGEVIVD